MLQNWEANGLILACLAVEAIYWVTLNWSLPVQVWLRVAGFLGCPVYNVEEEVGEIRSGRKGLDLGFSILKNSVLFVFARQAGLLMVLKLFWVGGDLVFSSCRAICGAARAGHWWMSSEGSWKTWGKSEILCALWGGVVAGVLWGVLLYNFLTWRGETGCWEPS